MGNSRHARRVIVLMALVALTHVWLIPTALSPAPDTFEFIRYAQRFGRESFAWIVRTEPHHPFYPLLLAAVEWFVRGVVGRATPEGWRVAAQIAALVPGVFLVVPLYGMALELFSARIAWWTCLVFALMPVPNRITGDGLSDGLHLFWFTLGLWAAAAALNRKDPYRLVLAGLAAGAAYWTRPEALVLPLAVLILLGIIQAVPSFRWPAARVVCAAGGLSIAVTATLAPYVVLKGGKLTDKAAFRHMLGVEPALARRGPPAADGVSALPGPKNDLPTARAPAVLALLMLPSLVLPEPTILPSVPELARATSQGAAARQPAAERVRQSGHRQVVGVGGALRNIALVFVDAIHYGWLAFAAWAMVIPWATTSRKPAAYLLAVVASIHVIVLVRLHIATGYLASRHTLLLVVAVAPWVGSGVALWIDRFVRIAVTIVRRLAMRSDEAALRAGIRLAAIAVAALIGLPKMLQPLHLSRWGHRQAANWLAAHDAQHAPVLDQHAIASFYTGAKRYRYQQLFAAMRDPRLRYVVVEGDDLRRTEPLYLRLREFVAELGPPQAAFPYFENDTENGVFVYAYSGAVATEDLRDGRPAMRR